MTGSSSLEGRFCISHFVYRPIAVWTTEIYCLILDLVLSEGLTGLKVKLRSDPNVNSLPAASVFVAFQMYKLQDHVSTGKDIESHEGGESRQVDRMRV
jgi:hypothetical protein